MNYFQTGPGQTILSRFRMASLLLLSLALFSLRALATDEDSNSIPDLSDTNFTSPVAVIPEATPTAEAPVEVAPEPGELPTPGIVSNPTNAPGEQIRQFQTQLELARKQRREKYLMQAAGTLVTLLQANVPVELKRPALFELALTAQDDNQLVKAQQLFNQYLHVYQDDATTPEVLLRQGLIYRQMGVTSLAISKFYAVMSTALKLKLENMDYYKKLVLQAQIEIADTYYLEGKYAESADYFSRLLKNPPADLDQPLIEYKLVRSLYGLTNYAETVAQAQMFLNINPGSSDVPEVRFLLASTLKKLGRNQDSLKQVLLLLQSERENVNKNPEVWAYWQRRAGNEIAAQLFKEGDYLDALQINLSLADLDHSSAWQLPVWYQTGLVYEQLEQWQKAEDIYQRIVDRRGELADPAADASLLSLSDMAKWRKEYIAWLEKAKTTNQTFEGQGSASSPSPAGLPGH